MTSGLDFRYHFTCIFVEGARFGHLGPGQTVSSGPMTKKMVQDLINSINSSEKVGTSELFESGPKNATSLGTLIIFPPISTRKLSGLSLAFPGGTKRIY